MITYQVLKVGQGESTMAALAAGAILATKGTYVDALAEVVAIARRYPGTRLHARSHNVWTVQHERQVRRSFLLSVREVRR